ncbi:unnamed protein product [Pocillopora meandrina]|uniref:Uncharacterized protein n=1 Tax=Pocillopora meandrina TaxID=46732 RepID=A0AAU9W331_9CNID|nr:unnamed protein product [Pocillopora meandrina]
MFTKPFFAESFIKSYPVNAKNEKFYCLSQRCPGIRDTN